MEPKYVFKKSSWLSNMKIAYKLVCSYYCKKVFIIVMTQYDSLNYFALDELRRQKVDTGLIIECWTFCIGVILLTFRRNMLPPSS